MSACLWHQPGIMAKTLQQSERNEKREMKEK
jgi:hypothetical protein